MTIPSGSAWVDTSPARDLTGGQKPATYSRPPSRVTPLHSVGDRAVFPRKPEEIHGRPSSSVAVDPVQRSQVQILPPLQDARGPHSLIVRASGMFNHLHRGTGTPLHRATLVERHRAQLSRRLIAHGAARATSAGVPRA